MDLDLLVMTADGSGFEAAIAAARLGLRVAVVDDGDHRVEEPALRHAVKALQSLRHEGEFRTDRRPPISPSNLERLWTRTVDVATREHRFQRDELRRHRVEFIARCEDVNARRTFGIRRPEGSPLQRLAADRDNVVSFATLMQLPRLPDRVTVATEYGRGLGYATFLAELGVDVTFLWDGSQPCGNWDVEVIDHVLNRDRPGRIRGVEWDAPNGTDLRSGTFEMPVLPDFILVEQSTKPASCVVEADAEVVLIDDVPGAGDAAVLREFQALQGDSPDECRLADTLPAMASAGRREDDLFDDGVPFESATAALPDGGLLKLLFHRHNRRLLGVHCAGENARQFADIGRALLTFSGTIDDLRGSLFADPAAAEPFRIAAKNGLKKLQARALPSLNLSVHSGVAERFEDEEPLPASPEPEFKLQLARV